MFNGKAAFLSHFTEAAVFGAKFAAFIAFMAVVALATLFVVIHHQWILESVTAPVRSAWTRLREKVSELDGVGLYLAVLLGVIVLMVTYAGILTYLDYRASKALFSAVWK